MYMYMYIYIYICMYTDIKQPATKASTNGEDKNLEMMVEGYWTILRSFFVIDVLGRKGTYQLNSKRTYPLENHICGGHFLETFWGPGGPPSWKDLGPFWSHFQKRFGVPEASWRSPTPPKRGKKVARLRSYWLLSTSWKSAWKTCWPERALLFLCKFLFCNFLPSEKHWFSTSFW